MVFHTSSIFSFPSPLYLLCLPSTVVSSTVSRPISPVALPSLRHLLLLLLLFPQLFLLHLLHPLPFIPFSWPLYPPPLLSPSPSPLYPLLLLGSLYSLLFCSSSVFSTPFSFLSFMSFPPFCFPPLLSLSDHLFPLLLYSRIFLHSSISPPLPLLQPISCVYLFSSFPLSHPFLFFCCPQPPLPQSTSFLS